MPSLADSSIAEINSNVKASQKALDALPKGGACANENKAQVDAASKTASDATAAASAAKTAADKAKKAPVTFKSATVMDIESGSCTAFYADPNYKTAKTAADTAAKTHNKKVGEKDAADKALKTAKDAQAHAIKQCACKAQIEHAKAAKAGQAANSAENKKAWDKAHMMKCVLAGTSANSCKVPPVPTVKVPALQEPAKSAKCGSETCSTCAGENQNCKCHGTVYYGRKYYPNKGNGAQSSISQLKKSGYKTKSIKGSVSCKNSVLGDPLKGYPKKCMCCHY